MSADTTDPDGIMRTEYTHDGCLIDDIDRIDLSDLQLNDNDDWLYIPPQCSTDSTIHDIYTWLKTEPIPNSQNHKKCVDTRTFTRPKKRSARMSFESIFEGLSPSVMNTLKSKNTNITHTEDVIKHLPETIRDKESVPPMLKPSIRMAMNILSEENLVTSGQESMEAFLNISQSKGIDSFINLGEPEYNDLLMNVSQPSILYTSVISSLNDSMLTKNDTMSITNMRTTQNSKDIEKNSNSVNETFMIQNPNDIITLEKTYCTNLLSNTYKESVRLNRDFSETYNTEVPGEASTPALNLNKEKTATSSSTFVTESDVDANATFIQLENEASNDIKSLDITYLSSAKGAESRNSSTSIMSKPMIHANKTDLNVTCDILKDETESAIILETYAEKDILDLSFKLPICNQSTPMNPNILNLTSKSAAKHLDQSRQTLYSTFKAPTSLRRELLAEIQRSGEHKLDSTYNHIPSDHLDSRDTKENIHIACNESEIDVRPLNRYHTYKKSALSGTTNQRKSQKEMAATAQKELPMDQRKFYTFTKKINNSIEKTDNTTNEKAETHSNMDSTFCKPFFPKVQQKRNASRILSKLPQFLQKSNPNLVSSSLKSAGGVPVSCTSISSIGYMKGSQPNIMQDITERSQLPSKLHPYGKLKSGSEQRLLEVNVNTNNQFPMKGVTAGSTESIESTQSAHSAPDLDDRLSTCSDSSNHNSCIKHTMNVEQLHQLVQMQEESLKQDSASKPNRRVLENTWVEAKTNLPSPILKNGVEYNEDNTYSVNLNTDSSMKCSSPIISPIGSSHALNNDGNLESNVANIKDKIVVAGKIEDPNEVMPKFENKTRLRQPTNWNTGNKPALMSGIPRPASRIPALRFARPNAKTTQADLRKGCI